MIYILIIIILFILLFKKNTIEGYDIKRENISFEDCAELCKTGSNCYGFGYNKQTSTCYPSQNTIMGPPTDTIHRGEYKKENATCNKFSAITTPLQKIPLDDRRKNSLFVCSESNNLFPQTFLHNQNKFENIGEGRNIDEIFQVDDYSVQEIKWPDRYINNNELTVLEDNNLNAKYPVKSVSEIENLLNRVPLTQVNNKIYTTNNNISSDFSNFFLKFKNAFTKKTDIQEYNKDFINYKIHTGINSGYYMYPHKCLSSISYQNCLDHCSRDNNCVGVEWNPIFNNQKNVCCPYKSINISQDRPLNKSMGRFYEKTKYGGPQSNKVISL